MLSLFVSNLSEEDEVFRFANSYAQPALILCVAPFIAFIFDKFTFFPSSPMPMIGADAAALVELLPHLCSYRESTSPSEGFFKVILSIIWKGTSPYKITCDLAHTDSKAPITPAYDGVNVLSGVYCPRDPKLFREECIPDSLISYLS